MNGNNTTYIHYAGKNIEVAPMSRAAMLEALGTVGPVEFKEPGFTDAKGVFKEGAPMVLVIGPGIPVWANSFTDDPKRG